MDTIPDRYEDEYPDVFDGDEQMCKQHLFYMSTTSEKKQLIRKFTVQFTLNDNSELSDIKILDSKIEHDGYQEIKDNYPKQLNDLEEYRSVIPRIFEEHSFDDPERSWNVYYFCYTDNFLSKFKKCDTYIMNEYEYHNDVYYASECNENSDYTDLDNKIIGITLKYVYNDSAKLHSYRNFIVYFEVDNRNYLDNITKIEEVLGDGTIIEVENNFGK